MSSSPNALNRRSFVTQASGVAALAALGSSSLQAAIFAGPSPSSAAETAVTEFYKSLSDQQKAKICFGFNHKLRNRINANWNITDPEIGSDFYTDRQRTLINQVVKGLTSEDGYSTVIHQMNDDAGGIDQYSVAVFGQPGEGDFEFELTGRHLTLRADGNSVDKAAFGGPIVYGHGIEEPKGNLFYSQTLATNKVFQALDADQAKKALVKSNAPRETAVELQGPNGNFPGIAVGELKGDQQEVVKATLRHLLAPFREEDRDEVMEIVNADGLEKLHMAFYAKGDLESDQVWDIWRVEGPSFVWHFRGAPHVHAYINIARTKSA